ncbi:MAG: flagellar motor protein MotB [Candidatus Melainabacteria bacterium]
MIQPPPTITLLKRMADWDDPVDGPLVETGHSRWVLPYADMLTLLLGLFLVLSASISMPRPAPAKAPSPTAVTVPQAKTPAPVKKAADTLRETVRARLEKEVSAPVRQAIAVRQDSRGVILSLKDSLLFEPGQAELDSGARRRLDELVAVLKTMPNALRIEGHTDNTPIATAQYPSNWELSTARATSILRYLVVGHHVPPARLSATGYGEYQPVTENSSIEGKRKNRRVDIVILYAGAQTPPQTSVNAPPDSAGAGKHQDTP